MRGLHAARDRGSVTAELVVALPAVLIVLAVCLGGVRLGMQSMSAQDAAAVAARSIARGEGHAAAAGRAASLAPGAAISVFRRDGLVCATATLPGVAPAMPLRPSGTACALEGPT